MQAGLKMINWAQTHTTSELPAILPGLDRVEIGGFMDSQAV